MDRIINGQESEPHRFPFQIFLVSFKSGNEMLCSGSIISNEWIITAAHCVDKAGSALVYLGAHSLANVYFYKKDLLQYQIDIIVIHPNYDPKKLTNDIALLKLPERIDYSNTVNKVNLPSRSDIKKDLTKEIVIASGWGSTNDADPNKMLSPVLNYIEVPIIPTFFCFMLFPLFVKETNLCTKAVDFKSVCQGDSGGPLIQETEYGSKATLVGIISAVTKAGCKIGFPSIYTNVAYYVDWISRVTGIEISD